jgi:hypothetical protein
MMSIQDWQNESIETQTQNAYDRECRLMEVPLLGAANILVITAAVRVIELLSDNKLTVPEEVIPVAIPAVGAVALGSLAVSHIRNAWHHRQELNRLQTDSAPTS